MLTVLGQRVDVGESAAGPGFQFPACAECGTHGAYFTYKC